MHKLQAEQVQIAGIVDQHFKMVNDLRTGWKLSN